MCDFTDRILRASGAASAGGALGAQIGGCFGCAPLGGAAGAVLGAFGGFFSD